MAFSLQPYQTDLIEKSMQVGSLKFGSFVLKSGRTSPYFFNAGLISTGSLLNAVASAYAATIAKSLSAPSSPLPPFDVLFGPAYKGISLAACTSLLLYSQHNLDVGFAYDRKEAKDHGEGGVMVGVPVKGKKVLILDDVMTAGTAIRGSIDKIKKEGGEVIGVVLMLDREEVGKDGASTVREVEEVVGGAGRVTAILKMRDLMVWLDKNGMKEDLASMEEYWEKYGIKG
ncbi:hypothetical protein JAAARDRAFT_32465 [Jaapia argillacea MUCL 33604]|uniref:orotate phosphoribosyltransferase n=1 Tax=Jaapia argillacea MUCL 33604 TaxID=933084 RepID=A0A067Q9A2_9AGAM|nr:hypothetical protein JAAARDRAFT_32465 [Jaapia argillacea MUCL 33604]